MIITSDHLFWSFVQVIIIYLPSGHGAHIQLFKDNNFTDLHNESYPTGGCYNIPNHWVGSIITDTCFIAYNQGFCRAPYSSRFMPGKIITNDFSNGYAAGIDSIRTCDDQEGGPQLNVDITDWFEAKYPPTMPDVLESYYNVCACVNIPKFVHYMGNWSIDNHGNSLIAYYEHDCTEKNTRSLHINAGHWRNSRDMHKHTKKYGGTVLKIHSFGPDPNAPYFPSCSTRSLTHPPLATGNSTKINSGNICLSNTTTESALAGLLFMQVVSELQQISKKVDELKQINQQTGISFENVKSFFEGKLQMQRDEYKYLTNKIKADLNDLFS